MSAAAVPVLLVGGWTSAGRLQPHFNPVADTISALAEPGAADTWVMTATLLVVSICVVMTGLALRPAAAPGRLILMAGGVAGLLVAANPEHYGGSMTHAIWATAVFAALTIWPVGAWRRGPSEPWALRPAIAAGAAATLLCLVAWFVWELITRGGQAGAAERALGGMQALWPLAVVLSCRWHPGVSPQPMIEAETGGTHNELPAGPGSGGPGTAACPSGFAEPGTGNGLRGGLQGWGWAVPRQNASTTPAASPPAEQQAEPA